MSGRMRLEAVRQARAPRNITNLNYLLMRGVLSPDMVIAELNSGQLRDSWQGALGIFQRTQSLAQVAKHAIVGAPDHDEPLLTGTLSGQLTVVEANELLTSHSTVSGYSGPVIAARLMVEADAFDVAVSVPERPGPITPWSDQVRTVFRRV